MVAIKAATPYSAYQSYGAAHIVNAAPRAAATAAASQGGAEQAATAVTLSEAARAALSQQDFATILAETRASLSALLTDAGRTSPLHNGQLALDLSTLDQRQLYAMSSDESFTEDERQAAGLEMQRRFEAALAGPAAIARVTGNYSGLYKAAATYLDGLGPEERASSDWQAGRDAVTEGLKQVQTRPGNVPDAGPSDPVALYLALSRTGDTVAPPSMTDMAANARTTLDRLYAEAKANGKAPSFNRDTTTGTYIDVSNFSSRALSSMVLDQDGRFSDQEVHAARAALQSKSGASLLASFQSAAKSGDPTAFSQNIIAAFSSLSPEEREAVGWSDQLYQTAMQSYASTTKLLDMFTQAGGNAGTGLASLLGR
ncbi:MAG: hypothetical protein ABS75_14600 [Pelagibacterium sp. SCN 63-23]|nr:MAG: hypothetical protein ABS75_14600 [Pelagibacterium sp. SCN 63-23]